MLILAAIPLFFPAIGISVNECNPPLKDNISDSTLTECNPECANKGETLVTAYYCVFSVLWGIGYASIKISHLSMMPILAPSENDSITLNSINYAVDVMSIICVYGASWLFIRTGNLNL